MKLDWRKTFLIGFGFFGISVIWQLYNAFVPIFLQAGRPGFETSAGVNGFGLNAATTGLIMGLDNLAAIFILPLIGVWSDRVRTPIGRRYPFIVTAAPIAAVAFLLLPFAVRLIDPAASGSVAANTGPFVLFIVAAGLMLLAMAVLRTPVISLMPDLTPSPLRSKANGVINFMGGVGFIVATFGLARLFNIEQILPFIGGAVVLLVAVFLLFATVREPKPDELEAAAHELSEEEQALSGLKGWNVVPAEQRGSLIFLLLAIFSWFVAYDGVGTFFTSYAVNVLGVSEGFAPTLFGIAGLTFILFAIPAGFVGERLGRRRTISLGLAIFAVMLVVGYFLGSTVGVGAVLAVGGIGWALVNINSLPMVVDTTTDPRLLGTYTGLYYLASQTGSALAPGIMGVFVDVVGSYRSIFLVAPVFFALAVFFMSRVTRGEAHAVAATAPVEA